MAKKVTSGSQKKAAGKKVPTGFIKEETELSFAQIDRAVLTVKPSDIAIIKKLIPEIPVGQSRSVIEGIFKARPDVLGLEREVICVALTTLLGKVPSVKKGLTSEEKKLLPELIERISDIETAATEAEDEDESEEGVEGEEDAELDDDDAAPIDEEEEEDGPVAEDGAVSEEERDSDSSFNEDTMSLIPVIDDPAQLGNWGQIERRPTSQVFFKLTSRSLYGYGVRPNGVKDYDEAGKLIKGGVIGASQPGFIKVSLNTDSKTAALKPYENVWHEGCSYQKKFLGVQLAARSHSQRVWDLKMKPGQTLGDQLEKIGEWVQSELLGEDGPVAAAITDLQSTLKARDDQKKAEPIIRKKKIMAADDVIQAAAKKAKLAKKY